MRMKSYFASSVQTAMEQARRELGGEAILVTSRLAPAEAGKARQYEVVFATEVPERIIPEKNAPGPLPAPTVKHAASAAGHGTLTPASLEAVLSEIKGIRRQMQTWLPRSVDAPGNTGKSAREILTLLSNAEVDPDLAQQLVASAMERLSRRSPVGTGTTEDLRAALAACIADAFPVETGLAADSSRSTAMAMIGPPGAGKTAAIAKIAIRYGLSRGKPVLLVSADNLRVAASEQLRGYAAVLGLRFELAPSSRALGQLLEDHRGYGLILIDTPGFSASESEAAGEPAGFLARQTGIQKHLVLPAPARSAEMNRIYSTYEIFKPSHLIFSRTDETTVFGPALSEAMGRGLPVSFFSTGSRVPEDIAEASAEFIANRLMPAQPTQQRMSVAA